MGRALSESCAEFLSVVPSQLPVVPNPAGITQTGALLAKFGEIFMYVMEPTGEYRQATTEEIAATMVSRLTAMFDRSEVFDQKQVQRFLIARYALAKVESVGAILLCSQQRLLGVTEIARGSLSHCAIEPRQIVSAALEHNAARVVLFHNHPSGCPDPSASDLLLTRRVAEACFFFSLMFDDHIIVAGPACYSFVGSENAHLLNARRLGFQ